MYIKKKQNFFDEDGREWCLHKENEKRKLGHKKKLKKIKIKNKKSRLCVIFEKKKKKKEENIFFLRLFFSWAFLIDLLQALDISNIFFCYLTFL